MTLTEQIQYLFWSGGGGGGGEGGVGNKKNEQNITRTWEIFW